MVFPALYRANAPTPAQAAILEGEASCFFHPQKKAAMVCETCGRFLCALCDLDLNGKHICPSCLESGKQRQTIAELQESRVVYDRLVLALSTLPWLICGWGTLVGAPVAIYLSIRHWNAPCGVTGRARWMFVTAIIISAISLLFWAVILFSIITRR
jgi:hypothetical protein